MVDKESQWKREMVSLQNCRVGNGGSAQEHDPRAKVQAGVEPLDSPTKVVVLELVYHVERCTHQVLEFFKRAHEELKGTKHIENCNKVKEDVGFARRLATNIIAVELILVVEIHDIDPKTGDKLGQKRSSPKASFLKIESSIDEDYLEKDNCAEAEGDG